MHNTNFFQDQTYTYITVFIIIISFDDGNYRTSIIRHKISMKWPAEDN